MAELSERAKDLGTENAFVVLKEVQELQAKGKEICNFCIGQPDFPTPENIRRAAARALEEGKTGYTASAGILELREAAAEHLTRTRGADVGPDDVVVGCGAKPFIGYTILSVTDFGAAHEVIYPNPGFPIYESLVRAYGARPRPLQLRERLGFRFDLDELAAAVNENTRLLILGSPHNPTGSVLAREHIEGIAAILAKWPKIWVFSDDPYAALVYDGVFESVASQSGMAERTVLCDSASKTYAMTGWRVGFAANRRLAPSLARWITNTDSCAPHPNQWAVVEALRGPQDAVVAMRDTFHERRDRIVAGLNDLPGVTCQSPGGAFYVWPNVTEACARLGAADSEEFRKRLLHEAGVAVLSDIHFGTPDPSEGQHIRFSYASSMETIDRGLERVAAFLRKA